MRFYSIIALHIAYVLIISTPEPRKHIGPLNVAGLLFSVVSLVPMPSCRIRSAVADNLINEDFPYRLAN